MIDMGNHSHNAANVAVLGKRLSYEDGVYIPSR